MLVDPSFQVLAQYLSGDGESISIDKLILQQVMQDDCRGNGQVRSADHEQRVHMIRRE